jgi:hypothetical protein
MSVDAGPATRVVGPCGREDDQDPDHLIGVDNAHTALGAKAAAIDGYRMLCDHVL